MLLLAATFFATQLNAATLEVTLTDRGGSPIAHQQLLLNKPATSRHGSVPDYAITDDGGHAVFPDLAPGRYSLGVRFPVEPTLIAFDQDPLAAQPHINIGPGDESVDLVATMGRGAVTSVLITTYPTFAQREPQSLRFHHEDTGFRFDLEVAESRSLALATGRWRVTASPRPGTLLLGVEADRVPTTGSFATVDIQGTGETHVVSFEVGALARLNGTIDFDPHAASCVVALSLLEAGSWIDGARKRGGSVFEQIEAVVEIDPSERGSYDIALPDGRWQAEIRCTVAVASRPERPILVVTAGETKAQDFEVTVGGGNQSFTVDVVNEEGERIKDATVVALDADNAIVGTAVSDRGGLARVAGSRSEVALIVATHRDYLEGEVLVTGGTARTVTLRNGAVIHVRAREGEVAIGNVIVDVYRDSPPPTRMTVPDRKTYTTTTDARGRAIVKGLYPGSYRAHAIIGGRRGHSATVALKSEGESTTAAEDIGIFITANEEIRLDAVVTKAASFVATLACRDGGELPRATIASFRGADTERRPINSTINDTNHLEFGPIPPGNWAIELRPLGHDRGQWVLGGDEASAGLVSVVAGEASDLGLIEFTCGPVIELKAKVMAGNPAPDLTLATAVIGRWTRVEDGRTTGGSLSAQPLRDRIEFLGAPEGAVSLEFSLRHPHLLPSARLEYRASETLTRGRVAAVYALVAGVGGAIEVTSTAAWIQLEDAKKGIQLATTTKGVAWFPALPAGLARLVVCGDEHCTPASRGTTVSIDVEAGVTRRMTFPAAK